MTQKRNSINDDDNDNPSGGISVRGFRARVFCALEVRQEGHCVITHADVFPGNRAIYIDKT